MLFETEKIHNLEPYKPGVNISWNLKSWIKPILNLINLELTSS